MQARIRNFFKVLSRKRREVVIVLLWSFAIAFILIKIFWLTYIEVPRLQRYHIIYALYNIPAPQLKV